MKRLKKPLTILAIVALAASGIYGINQKNCECGSHATGITTYNVASDGGCCSGAAGPTGFHYIYSWDDGAWALVSRTEITGAQAQSNCCTDA